VPATLGHPKLFLGINAGIEASLRRIAHYDYWLDKAYHPDPYQAGLACKSDVVRFTLHRRAAGLARSGVKHSA
jgi:hypothetical protein